MSGARKGTRIGFAIATLVFATADGSFGDETEAIQVVGSYEFKFQVRMALQLIEDELPHTFSAVAAVVGRIEQWDRSGMWAHSEPPTLRLGDRTAFYSVTWCAGFIVHDTCHAWLYREGESTSGVEAEKTCNALQYEFLRRVRAPYWETQHVRNLSGSEHDSNGNGSYDWEDYWMHDW